MLKITKKIKMVITTARASKQLRAITILVKSIGQVFNRIYKQHKTLIHSLEVIHSIIILVEFVHAVVLILLT